MSGPAKTVLTVLVFFTLSKPAPARETYSETSQAEACGSITNAQPGTGVAYRDRCETPTTASACRSHWGKQVGVPRRKLPFTGLRSFSPINPRRA